MKTSLISTAFFSLVLSTSLLAACGGSDDDSSKGSCSAPSSMGTSSADCKACVEKSCSDEYSAYCSSNCSSSASSSACQKASQNIGSCVFSNCLAECDDGSSSADGGAGSDLPGGTGGEPAAGEPTTTSCKALKACCDTLPNKQTKDPCLQAAGYDNDAPCLNLLNTYKAANQCGGGGDPGTSQDKVACYNTDDGSCTAAAVPASYKEQAEQGCTDDGGSVADECPTKDLVGCCTLGGAEICQYAGGSAGLDESSCKAGGGAWSTTP